MKANRVLFLIGFLSIGSVIVNTQVRVFSEWSLPVSLGTRINTEFNDLAAVLSNDQRTIFFTSDRDGNEDIWVSRRQNSKSPWSFLIKLGPSINTQSNERVRSLSADDRILIYQSNRPDGFGGEDLWMIERKNPSDDYGWSDPVNLGPAINTSSGNEIAAAFAYDTVPQEPLLFFSSTRQDLGNLGGGDIYQTTVFGAFGFGSPINQTILNTPSIETCFWVSNDGLEIVFSSNRPSLTGDISAFDLWSSSRKSVVDPWSSPENLGPTINVQGFTDVNPFVSADETTLLFTSRRPGRGGSDIYISKRTRLTGPKAEN